MKVATWNVNSLRVRFPHVLKWLEREQPDLLALQETKLKDEDFPADTFRDHGYSATFSGQPAYNGVAILSREPPSDVSLRLRRPLRRRAEARARRDVRRAAPLEPVRAERPERRVRQVPLQARVARGAARARSPTSSRAIRRCSSSATSTSRPTTATFTIPPRGQARCSARRPSGRRSRRSRARACATRSGCSSSPKRSSAGGITAGSRFAAIRGCESTSCWPRSVKSNVLGMPDRQGTARLGAAFGPRAGRRRIRCR